MLFVGMTFYDAMPLVHGSYHTFQSSSRQLYRLSDRSRHICHFRNGAVSYDNNWWHKNMTLITIIELERHRIFHNAVYWHVWNLQPITLLRTYCQVSRWNKPRNLRPSGLLMVWITPCQNWVKLQRMPGRHVGTKRSLSFRRSFSHLHRRLT